MLVVIHKTNNIFYAVIITSILMTIFNYFVITPIYLGTYGEQFDYLAKMVDPEYLKSILILYPLFNLLQ